MAAATDAAYLSCDWIEGGLAFNRRSLHTCLIVHHDRGLPFIAPFTGDDLPTALVLQERERIRSANRAGGHPACRGCPHLREARWPASPYPFRLLGIAHYAHCNIQCRYCFLQTQDRASFEDGLRPYPLLPTIRAMIDAGQLAPDAIVDWGGGEPITYREFDALFEVLIAHGTFHYIHTNGTVLPDAIRRTHAPERVHVICSVDAGLAATYQQIKQRDLLERVWENLAEYIQLGVKTSLKYIVLAENCDEENIRSFVERAARIGAGELILDVDYNDPDPAAAIVAGLAKLKYLASRAGISVRFGFTGDNFAPERRVSERLEEAFRAEQLAGIRALLEQRGYVPRACLDESVETVFQVLESHCAAKDAVIRRLADESEARRQRLLEQAAAIRRYEDERRELRRLRGLGRALWRAGLTWLRREPVQQV